MNKTDYAIIGYLYMKHSIEYDVNFLGDNYPDFLVEHINKIKRLSKKHHRLCEKYCNGGFARTDEYEFYLNEVENKIREICKLLYNVGYQFQNDPRGATVRIFVNGKDMTEILYL